MYLKKLEIQGFKSFADKTILEFMPGVTTVIGPNGSGKSNISDSIRWVLGEQSIKSLRGGKSEDVIFAGTSSRKALNFAEVSLTIDNTDGKLPIDYTEVVVTRRLYRTGESEYYINRNTCRLKDIVELFMDTGIGRDGYSIIGQGRIDEILSNNSTERRNVFEEAAGIAKYKARKTEAERKLESTRQNLLRITDIITELESKLGPLEKQSEKAQKYLKLRDELKLYEINNFLASTKKLEESLKTTTLHLDELNEELDQKNSDYTSFYDKRNELKTLLEEKINSYDILKSEIYNEQSLIEKLTSEISICEEKVNNHLQNINSFENDINDFETRKSELENEKAEKAKKIDYYNSQKESYVKTLAEKESELARITANLSDEELKIENMKSEIIDNLNEISDKKATMNGLSAMLTNMQNRKSQVMKELSDIAYETDKLNMQIEDVNEELRGYSSKSNSLIQIHNEYQAKKHAIQGKYDEAKSKLSELYSDINVKKAHFKFLSDTEKNRDGYFKSVKSILDKCDLDSNFKKGIHGTLAQLITVPEEYELAIETALASNLQSIITSTQDDAKKAIYFLKESHTGRATFFPIDSINAILDENITNRLSGESGFIGMAYSLIKFDKIYTQVVNSLLGKTIIVSTIDDAVNISKKIKGSYKIVSLDGDIVNTGGSMSGGSKKLKTDNLLSQKRNLSILEDDIAELEKNISKLEKVLSESTQKLEDLDKEFESSNEELKELEIKTAGLKEKINSLNTLKEANSSKKRTLEAEQQQLTEQHLSSSTSIEDLTLQIQNIEKNINEKQELVNEYKQKNKEQMQIRDNLNLDITDYKISISSFDESIESVNEIIARIYSDLSNLEMSATKRTEYKEKATAEIENLNKKIDEQKQKIVEISETISDKQNTLVKADQEKTSLNKEIETSETTLTNINLDIAQIKENISKTELKKAKLDMEFDNVNTRIWEDYEMTYNECLALKQDFSNINLNTKINSLRNQIKDLGNINIDAIAEYKEEKERYEFISTQKADLDKSEQNLQKIIADMTAIMKEEFLKKFNIINENFKEVFSELFGGGKALIKLADESNILESGIDIEVQPPGKKLQNMTLLSGGERAFTAIALLFAILKINPSPFCLLDEIEAALDDVNVYRFADYIKKFSDNIQFIVITHRKGTMEAADSIYGITMEERGISKLVSMKLKG